MAYFIENINTCTKKIIFNFDSLDLSDVIKSGLREKQQKASLKGFRPGKAPWAVIEKLFRPEVESDVLNRFVQDEYYKAVQDQKLQVIGFPEVSNLQYAPGEKISFDALVQVVPEVNLPDYSQWIFEQEKVEVSSEEVEKMLQMQLEHKSTMETIADPEYLVAVGDFAVINFAGEQADGTRPESMQAKEHQVEIGSGQLIPGFEDQIVGMKASESKEFPLVFPADYHVESLQGQTVKFTVELLEIKQKNSPALTDELAQEMGSDTVENLRQEVRNHLLAQKERKSLENVNQQIIERLVQETLLPDLPSTLVSQQEEVVRAEVKKSLERNGYGQQQVEEYFVKWSEELEKKAIFQIKSGLILNKLAEDLQVTVTPTDLEEKVAAIAAGYGVPADRLRSLYAEGSSAQQNLYYALKEEKTLVALKSCLTVKTV